MNFRDAYEIARNNIKGRKKIGGLISVIFFIALFICFFVNSMAGSIDRLVKSMREIPMARTLTFNFDENVPKDFVEICKDLDHVEEVIPFTFQMTGDIDGMESISKLDTEIKSYSGAYDEYIVEGEAPKKGEILVPHYMNPGTGGRYRDGSEYIGKNITVHMENQKDEERVFTYKVSGTYDNIYAVLGMEPMFLQADEAVVMKEFTYEGAEEELAKLQEENPGVMYMGYEMTYEYAVVVDSYKHVSEVAQQLSEKLGVYSSTEIDMSENELQKMFDIFQFIGAALTVILVIAVIIMMVIMIGGDIRGRKKEMAMYMVQGYTKQDLQKILFMEYVRRLTPVLITAATTNKLIMMLENLGIKLLFTIEFQILHMDMGLGTLLVGIAILVIVLMTANHYIGENLRKLELLKEIRSEG